LAIVAIFCDFKNLKLAIFFKQGICYRIFFSQKENLAKWRKSTTKTITALAIFGGPFRFSFSPVANKIKSSASHHTKGILWEK